MESSLSTGPPVVFGRRFLLSAAAFVIVVAGMRAAASILVPFLLAAFIAILCSAPLAWLKRVGVPKVIAVTLVVVGLLAISTIVVMILGTSLIDFTLTLPLYQQRLQTEVAGFLNWLQARGFDVSDDVVFDFFEPGRILGLVGNMLTALRGVLTNTFLIIVTMVFILIELWNLPAKLQAALGERVGRSAHTHYSSFTQDVQRYVALKTMVSLATGAGVAVWLSVLGVSYPLLWGLLAFLLNYVPTIGSYVAAIPAVLFAFLQLGLGPAILAAIGFLVVNLTFGNVVEPRLMGRGFGLSMLVVFLSLVFWGWVLGPVGMLLSVPLTVILRLALEGRESTRWLAVLLGSGVPGEEVPAEAAPSA